MQSNPNATIQVKGQQKKVVAEVVEPEKRRKLWARLIEIAHMYKGYEKHTSREIPMVILHPSEEQ